MSNKDLSDNVYVNLTIPGTINATSGYPTLNVNKTIPIVQNPSEYYLSVIYAKIPLDVVPLTIVNPVPGQPDPNLLEPIIGVRNGGVVIPQNVIYVPQSINIYPPPLQSDPNRAIITPYYFIYSIDYYLSMFNTAIVTSHIAAGVAAPYPYFYLDRETNRISLVVSDDLVTAYEAGTYELLCNQQFFSYIEGFSTIFDYTSPLQYSFVLYRDGNTCNENGGQFRETGLDYLRYSQDHYALGNWYSLNKIVILSNTIPINREILSGKPGDPTDPVTVGLPIIFDYVPPMTALFQERSVAVYQNEGEMRFMDLNSRNPLTDISISLGWQDNLGNFYPLHISKNNSAHIKLAFIRKSLV